MTGMGKATDIIGPPNQHLEDEATHRSLCYGSPWSSTEPQLQQLMLFYFYLLTIIHITVPGTEYVLNKN